MSRILAKPAYEAVVNGRGELCVLLDELSLADDLGVLSTGNWSRVPLSGDTLIKLFTMANAEVDIVLPARVAGAWTVRDHLLLILTAMGSVLESRVVGVHSP